LYSFKLRESTFGEVLSNHIISVGFIRHSDVTSCVSLQEISGCSIPEITEIGKLEQNTTHRLFSEGPYVKLAYFLFLFSSIAAYKSVESTLRCHACFLFHFNHNL